MNTTTPTSIEITGGTTEVNSVPITARKKLKVLEVASGLPGWGGTEIHLLNLGEELKARGHDVSISCQPGRFVEAEAQRRGLQTIAATCRRQNSLWPIFRYIALLRQGKYDVVHVHWDNDYKVPGIAARFCRVPVVLLSHHSPYPFKRPLNRWLYTKVLYNRLIALSESVRMLLLTQGASDNKVTTIHHGIDPLTIQTVTVDRKSVRSEWNVPEDTVLVGLVGRVGVEKGVHTFVKALAKLNNDRIIGIFIGDGKAQDEVKQLADKLGVTNKVRFAGFRRDVGNAINSLDIHVLASIWAEPCAAVIEQAMALSKPVIGTSIGGTPEIIEADRTGLLVPPGDASALAQAIDRLAADPHLRKRMGEAGRERVERLFNQRRMVDLIEQVYIEEYSKALAHCQGK